MIPFVAVVSLRSQESRTIRLWIPLILIWLLLLPLAVLLSPFIFVACLFCRVNPFRGLDVAGAQRPHRHQYRGGTALCRDVVPHSLEILDLGDHAMNDHRRQILQMLSEGKISADEAERLIAAAEQPASSRFADAPSVWAGKPRPKYLRVVVDSEGDGGREGPTKVNVRVPMQLLRAGVRLAGLLPVKALEHANQAMHQQGIPIDLTQIKPENLEEMIEHLNDLTVDVDQKDASTKVKVRVFCE
jgi:hypothetical protein